MSLIWRRTGWGFCIARGEGAALRGRGVVRAGHHWGRGCRLSWHTVMHPGLQVCRFKGTNTSVSTVIFTTALLSGCQSSRSASKDTAQTDPEAVVPVDDPTIGATGIIAQPHPEIGSLLVLTWQQSGSLDGHIEYSFDDAWLQTPALTAEDGDSVEAIVLGVPFETSATWRFVGTLDGQAVTSSEHAAQTAALPEGLPEASLLVADPAAWVDSDRYLLASINQDPGGWSGGTFWKFILDRQGRYVWAHQTPEDNWSIFLRISYDGDDILWDEATYWSQFDAGEASQVHRMKLDGTIVESVSTPGLHHAFVELDDETLVWGAADFTSETLRERRPGEDYTDLWTCRDSFGVDYCQSNTLYWHEESDTFLYSFYTNSSVIEVDHATGETLHYWGQNPDWGFEPSTAQFSWQHGVSYLPGGHLLLSTHTTAGVLETVVREYAIDEKTQTLQEVWSFGEGEGIHADTAGEAHRLLNGNTLHNYGSSGHLREVTSDGEIVWEVEWAGTRLLGRSVFIDDLYTFL